MLVKPRLGWDRSPSPLFSLSQTKSSAIPEVPGFSVGSVQITQSSVLQLKVIARDLGELARSLLPETAALA